MRLGYCLLISALSVLPSSTYGSVHLVLSGEPSFEECDIAYATTELKTVYVIVKAFNEDVAGLAFSAPVPTGGYYYAGDVALSGSILNGNSQTGVTVGLGACESGSFVVMGIQIVGMSSSPECTPFQATEHFELGATYMDCSFTEREMSIVYARVLLNSDGTCSHATLPSNPVPANGAVDVPLVTTLNWDDAEYLCEAMLCGNDDQVYFGTTTDPPLLGYWFGGLVGPLQPGTTYYWRARNGCPPSQIGPLWSFTTTTDVATKQSTWGAIKALYR